MRGTGNNHREADNVVRSCFLALLATALLGGCAPSRYAPLDEVVPPILEADRIPGAVIVIGTGDRVQYRRAFGTARPDTLFDLASVTKAVATTTAAMLLVEEGRLTLDDDPGRWVEGLRGRGFTIRRLLTHETGLPAYLSPRGREGAALLDAITRLEADGRTRYS